jgi:hypothetical protein
LRRSPVLQSRGALAELDARNWLEDVNADLRFLNPNPAAPQCAADSSPPGESAAPSPARVALSRQPTRNDVVVTGRLGSPP